MSDHSPVPRDPAVLFELGRAMSAALLARDCLAVLSDSLLYAERHADGRMVAAIGQADIGAVRGVVERWIDELADAARPGMMRRGPDASPAA